MRLLREQLIRKRWIAALPAILSAMLLTGRGMAAEEYRLGAGDSVRITAYNNPDLTTEARIAEDGSIPMPLIGRANLAGLTKAEAEQRLGKLYTEGGFLRQAAFNLAVTEYRSQQVSVLGAVGKPGKYAISSVASVLDVLAEAGGIAETGSSVIRLVQHDQNGAPVEREIDVRGLVGGGNGADVTVRHGDVIYVATRPVFYIYGEVQKPGAYPLERDMTVRQAIATGGGLTIRGTERGLKISRRTKKGDIETKRAKLTDQLGAGDVLQVKESWF
jgi:polysaccharide biosynthesis/export protein